MESVRSKFKSYMAWIGSFFLWFVTPTKASELWEKWLDEMDKKSTPPKGEK